MIMTIKQTRELFESKYYKPAYKAWRIDSEKAGKDIIGENYEMFRKELYEKLGFEVDAKTKKVFGTNYNPDLIIKNNNEIVIIEEAKGHYVDSCFLTRAISDAAKIMNKCIKDDINLPYFILSCSTKMRGFEERFVEEIEVLRKDIREALLVKFIYLPLCEHGRIQSKNYFTTDNNCFELNNELIKKQNNIIMEIKNES